MNRSPDSATIGRVFDVIVGYKLVESEQRRRTMNSYKSLYWTSADKGTVRAWQADRQTDRRLNVDAAGWTIQAGDVPTHSRYTNASALKTSGFSTNWSTDTFRALCEWSAWAVGCQAVRCAVYELSVVCYWRWIALNYRLFRCTKSHMPSVQSTMFVFHMSIAIVLIALR